MPAPHTTPPPLALGVVCCALLVALACDSVVERALPPSDTGAPTADASDPSDAPDAPRDAQSTPNLGGDVPTDTAQVHDTHTPDALDQDTGPRDVSNDTTAHDTHTPDAPPDDADPPQDADLPQDTSPPDDAGTPEDIGQPQDTTSDTSPEGVGTPCAVFGEPGECLVVADCTGDRVATPGFCPGPAEVQCCTAPLPPPDDAGGGDADADDPTDPNTCDPDARPQPNQGLIEPPGVDGCLPGMIPVTDALCIDRYEAALIDLSDPDDPRPWSPYFNPGDTPVRAVSLEGAVPQGYINQLQAGAACQASGKRLCSNTEWLRACQGAASLTFPYGDTRQDGLCNDARARHPAVEYFGSAQDWVFGRIDHPCLNQLDDGLALTGDHPDCVSPDGPLDMMGNLHEWTSDPDGTFRGGFYVDTYRNGPGCLYRTVAHSVHHWDYSTGFRCCADR